jgi:hypothetical protein
MASTLDNVVKGTIDKAARQRLPALHSLNPPFKVAYCFNGDKRW